MTIFENTLLNLMQEKYCYKDLWIYRSFLDLPAYWKTHSISIDQRLRFFAFSENEQELNVFGINSLSLCPNADIGSVFISSLI